MSGADINRVVIIGRLTRPAEKVTTSGGIDLIKFSLAVNRKKKQGDQWIDEAHYFDFIYWGKRASGIHPFLGKGQQIAVEGELRQNRWDQNGQKRSKVEIECSSVQLMGKSIGDNNALAQEPHQASYSPPQTNFEDDIPF